MTSWRFRHRADQLADKFRTAVCPNCGGTGHVVNDGSVNRELWRRVARLAPGRPLGAEPEIPPEFFDGFPRLERCGCAVAPATGDELLERLYALTRDQPPPAGPANGPDDLDDFD
jgi:hypothetical protein